MFETKYRNNYLKFYVFLFIFYIFYILTPYLAYFFNYFDIIVFQHFPSIVTEDTTPIDFNGFKRNFIYKIFKHIKIRSFVSGKLFTS